MRNAPDVVEVNGGPLVSDVDGLPMFEWLNMYETHGLFSVLDVEEAPLWVGQNVEASVRLPLRTNIRPGDRVEVAGKQWRVVTVRPNRAHLRVMLRRSE